MTVRIVVVGMLDSVHVARWLKQFENLDFTFWLFPSSPHRSIHPEIVKLTLEGKFVIVRGARLLGAPSWLVDRILKNRFRAWFLDRLIARVSPDIVHAIELQNAGYLCMQLKSLRSRTPPRFIVTNYGSDIFRFQNQPRHRAQLRALLARADLYSCECLRDVKLARDLGFTGGVLPVIPNSGGFTNEQLSSAINAPSSRTVLAVKGYWGWAGRANIALHALESIADEVRKFDIVVYSANLRTKVLASQVRIRSGLRVRTLSKGALSHKQMLELFSKSKVYVGISLSDGISTSLLEAMAMGAIPVQTSTACCNEWFTDTGVAIENLDVNEVALGIQRAINLALTTDSAAKNRETIRARASREEMARQASVFYQL